MSKSENTQQLVESVDHLFTTITPEELHVSMEQFMGSAIRDELNPRSNLTALWFHYEELRDFFEMMVKVYQERRFHA